MEKSQVWQKLIEFVNSVCYICTVQTAYSLLISMYVWHEQMVLVLGYAPICCFSCLPYCRHFHGIWIWQPKIPSGSHGQWEWDSSGVHSFNGWLPFWRTWAWAVLHGQYTEYCCLVNSLGSYYFAWNSWKYSTHSSTPPLRCAGEITLIFLKIMFGKSFLH